MLTSKVHVIFLLLFLPLITVILEQCWEGSVLSTQQAVSASIQTTKLTTENDNTKSSITMDINITAHWNRFCGNASLRDFNC